MKTSFLEKTKVQECQVAYSGHLESAKNLDYLL